MVSKATPPAQSVELWHLPHHWSKNFHSGASGNAQRRRRALVESRQAPGVPSAANAEIA